MKHQSYCNGSHRKCKKILICYPGCKCIEGYIRKTDKGVCIPKEDCEKLKAESVGKSR
jgi:hypothetical protein